MVSLANEGFEIFGDMNALLGHFHNFFLPLFRGHEHVCGSNKAYHVVPYHGAMSTVDIRDRCCGSSIVTKQEMDLIAGMLLGLCISWLLMWLDRVWKRGASILEDNPTHQTQVLVIDAKIQKHEELVYASTS